MPKTGDMISEHIYIQNIFRASIINIKFHTIITCNRSLTIRIVPKEI